jgi:hypothetical protein
MTWCCHFALSRMLCTVVTPYSHMNGHFITIISDVVALSAVMWMPCIGPIFYFYTIFNYAYVHTYRHMYIHIYIHTYLHTYIHTYIHTHYRIVNTYIIYTYSINLVPWILYITHGLYAAMTIISSYISKQPPILLGLVVLLDMIEFSCSTSRGIRFHQFMFDAYNYHWLKDMFMFTENWIVCFSFIECTTTVLWTHTTLIGIPRRWSFWSRWTWMIFCMTSAPMF